MYDFRKYGENTAVLCEDSSSFTYNDLAALSEEIGGKIPKRCIAAVLCSNTIGSLLGYTAFLNNHIVPIMIDEKLDTELMLQLIEEYKPKYIWCQSKDVELFEGLTEVYAVLNYVLLETKYDVEYDIYPDLALLLTTSGSTGSPKLVRQSYRNLISNTESIIEYLNIDEKEVTITTLPMHYTFGLSILNTHLYAGAKVVLTTKSIIQKEFWKLFEDAKITSFGGVPYTYELLNKLNFLKMDLPHLRYMTQAGGKLHPDLHKKMAEYAIESKKEFVVMYGQTEATARMSYLPAEKSLEKYGSMGIAIPKGKLALLDENEELISTPETVGELVYYGENVTLGYAECIEDIGKGDERQGKLITGDMAKFDEDGYFYIVGRKKRFLKIFGSRVNLDETERIIRGEFEGEDIVCGGVDDKLYIFTLNTDLQSVIKAFVKDKLNMNARAIKVVVIDEVPRSESGKTLYNKLGKYYE